jgi:HAD superfamily hydrolase (TIGR01549 family)
MEARRVEAVLFDLGGTLRKTTKRDDHGKSERAGLIRQVVEGDLPLEEFSRLLTDRYQAYRQWAQQTLVELNEVQLWTQWLLPDYPPEKIKPLAATLNRLWRDATGIREVYPETKLVVQELYRRGYLLGVVSNTISQTEIPLVLKASGLTDCFKAVVLSSVYGKRKPDPSILLAAAAKLGAAPSCCAYIGNRLDRDVLGARRAGFSFVIIVHHGHHSDRSPSDPSLKPDFTVHDLREILDYFPPRK